MLFHLIPFPFDSTQVSVDFFQKKSLEFLLFGIQVIHLWHDQWIRSEDIVRSRISALLGFSTCIPARRTNVLRIDKEQMSGFLSLNHLQGAVTARYAYGLFYQDQLSAVASFSAGRLMDRGGVIYRSFELLRYANMLNHTVVGGLGKLITCFIRKHSPEDIMTYADLDWGSGMGYKKLNFKQTDITPPQIFWVDPQEQVRWYPHRLPESLINEFKEQDQSITIDDFLTRKGYTKIYNAGNLKFLLQVRDMSDQGESS
ncbi:MAG: hypothetical protein LBQ60_00545 [Bacteroidales bacterium]|jgi:hypothetical protein|nr:hypothetical protein [Bacteroidales bacterium]